jgi:hypothetical protein
MRQWSPWTSRQPAATLATMRRRDESITVIGLDFSPGAEARALNTTVGGCVMRRILGPVRKGREDSMQQHLEAKPSQ